MADDDRLFRTRLDRCRSKPDTDLERAGRGDRVTIIRAAPFQTANDPALQSRVLSVSTQTAIQLPNSTDGSLQTRIGFFSFASIGGMPITASDGTYILEASAALSDGRVVKLNATVLCKPPGP